MPEDDGEDDHEEDAVDVHRMYENVVKLIPKVTIPELVFFYLNRILPWKAMRGRSHAIDDPVARILI